MPADLSLQPPNGVRLVLQSSLAEIRAGLRDLLSCALLDDLGEDCRSTVQIVLAEALNNIVEHAYAGDAGLIEVELWRDPACLRIQIRDSGRPMPNASLPKGTLPPLGAMEDLPEGGFGWFLIHSLALDLAYHREGGLNRLSFDLPVTDAA